MWRKIKRNIFESRRFVKSTAIGIFCCLLVLGLYELLKELFEDKISNAIIIGIFMLFILLFFYIVESLKDTIKCLSEANTEASEIIESWGKEWYKQYLALYSLKDDIKEQNAIVRDVIRNENGEEASTVEFEDIKTFALCIKKFNDDNLEYIESVLNNETKG